MMIVSADVQQMRSTPVELLPLKIRRYFYALDTDDFREIRLRAGGAVCVCSGSGKRYISKYGKLTESVKGAVTVSPNDIEEAVDILTLSSLYSAQDEIKNGFITARGGHRVGLCGRMTSGGDFVTDITGLNYRFAREVIGAADMAAEAVFNNGNIKSTLIVSSPGCGKTTFLRDLIRQISDKGVNVSVVDERGEIGAVHNGMPAFDLGANTDIFDMCGKTEGMKLMIRSMSPQVVAVDEIGDEEDISAIRAAARSGVSVFATIHASDWRKDIGKELTACFKCVISLSDRHGPGTVEELVYV
ncbi:MAG: Flp pilus assembly complex ATPase component TadA [Clostridia bacterium]|nr:Flp pilus assembly complex ATPase component TadA [Clostridia bacterium]